MAAITGNGSGHYLGIAARGVDGDNNVDTSSGAHRYWRVYFDSNQGGDSNYTINGIQLYDINDLDVACTDANGDFTDIYTTNSASTSDLPYYPFLGTYSGGTTPDWESASGEGNTEIWLQVEFVTAKDIRKYEIWNGGRETGNFDGAPNNFRLAYSDDGIVWYIRHTGSHLWPDNSRNAISGNWPDYEFIALNFTSEAMFGQASTSALTGTGISAPDNSTTATHTANLQPLKVSGENLMEPLVGGVGTAQLEFITGTGTCQNPSVMIGDVELLEPTGTGSAFVPNTATGSARLGYLSGAASTFDEADAAAIPLLTGTGSLGSGQVLTGSAELSALTANAATDSARLEPLTATGTSQVGNVLTAGTARIPRLTGAGTTNEASLALMTGTGESTVGKVLSGAVTLLRSTATGSMNQFPAIPALTGTGVAASGTAASGNVQLQRATGTGSANDTPSIQPLTATATMVPGTAAQGYNYLEELSVAGVMDNPQASSLAGSVQTKELTGSGLVISGNVYTASAALQKLTLAATATSGRIITGSITVPLLTGTGDILSDRTATVTIELPELIVTGSINAENATPTGNALTMNLKNKALTTYSEFGYNSFATFNGATLAASPSGVFSLTGDTDNGSIIAASIRLGKLDFDIQQLKAVDYVYAGYTSAGDLNLTVKADDGTEYEYTLEPREVGRHSSRVKVGKAIRGRYLQFGLDNVAGANFRLDTLEMVERVLGRKVG